MTDLRESRSRVRFRDPVEARGFTQVANIVLEDARLDPAVRLTYIVIKQYAWQQEETEITHAELARVIGRSGRQIRRYLQELVEAGLISVESGGQEGEPNVYWLERLENRYGSAVRPRSSGRGTGRIPKAGQGRQGGADTHVLPPRSPASSTNIEDVGEENLSDGPGGSAVAACGGGSSNPNNAPVDEPPGGAAVSRLNLDHLAHLVRSEFAAGGIDLGLVDEALRQYAQTAATGRVRHPLRYCLAVGRRLQAKADEARRNHETQRIIDRVRELCAHGGDHSTCEKCRNDARHGQELAPWIADLAARGAQGTNPPDPSAPLGGVDSTMDSASTPQASECPGHGPSPASPPHRTPPPLRDAGVRWRGRDQDGEVGREARSCESRASIDSRD